MMISSRRELLKYAGLAATVSVVGARRSMATQRSSRYVADEGAFSAFHTDPLIAHGLSVARSSGAHYADMRMTYTRQRKIEGFIVTDVERLHVGIRALVNGYWGFASGSVWTNDQIAGIAVKAVDQAKSNSVGKTRHVELAPIQSVQSGSWTMPVQIDPFDVHPAEIMDLAGALSIFGSTMQATVRSGFDFLRQDKAFGSTEGGEFRQRTYRTGAAISTQYRSINRSLHLTTTSGLGYEMCAIDPLRNAIEETVDELRTDDALPVRSVDVGRYTLLLDAPAMTEIVSSTIGLATELDRAMGYEANAGGTSYLSSPEEMLGSYKLGNSQITVVADRNTPGAVNTVCWDDEGVLPQPTTLVENGVLVGFQTTRETASWLESNRQGNVKPASCGAAHAPTAGVAPMTACANLQLLPGKDDLSAVELISDIKRGILFSSIGTNMDFQQLNGYGIPSTAYEIVNGRKAARLVNAGFLFRAPEIWKGIRTLGGRKSSLRLGLRSMKGQPSQSAFHSVTAVPAVLDDANIVDITRKA